jgi:hypothetical protein
MKKRFSIFGLMALWVVLSLGILAAEPAKPALPALPAVMMPYLQNPAADRMTLCFLAQGAKNVQVAWGADGAWSLKKTAAEATPIANTPWTAWKLHLANLRPGQAYQYQVRYQLDGKAQSTPTYHFRTPDPQAKTLRAIAFNDLHNRDAIAAALMQHVKPDDFEFTLLLGDCWGDPSAKDGAAEVFRTWDAYIRLFDGASKPIVFVRGNHETRGNFASQLANLFDLPNLDAKQKWGEEQWQFTLRAGPVCFLAMDAGEDDDGTTAVNSYKNPNLWQKVRQNEAEWLKTQTAAKIGQDTPWRLFLCHIPLYNSPWISVRARDCWAPLLPGFNPDLMLAGHDHTWRRTVPPTDQAPWPVLVGGGPALQGGEEGTVMLLSATAKSLNVRLLGAKDGRLLTEFTKDQRQAPATAKGTAGN